MCTKLEQHGFRTHMVNFGSEWWDEWREKAREAYLNVMVKRGSGDSAAVQKEQQFIYRHHLNHVIVYQEWSVQQMLERVLDHV